MTPAINLIDTHTGAPAERSLDGWRDYAIAASEILAEGLIITCLVLSGLMLVSAMFG